MTTSLWPAGSATGIGSMPGTDVAEAIKFSFGELTQLPYLPELPERGPGADMIGRSAGMLVDLPVELYTGRWRVAANPGRELRRTHDLTERDLDQLTEQAEGYVGPLKVQCAGPWTLAASIELPMGNAILSDHGAVRDLAASLGEGLRLHVADLRRRIPGADILLQLDEPSLPAVLAGHVSTPSGLHTYRHVPANTARDTLAAIVAGVGAPVIAHCCASDAPLTLLREAGMSALAIDLDQVTELDPIGEAIDAGLGLLAGTAPTRGPADGRAPTGAGIADRIWRLWRTLGFADDQLAETVAVTPACGLAGAPRGYAEAVMLACRDAARRLTEG